MHNTDAILMASGFSRRFGSDDKLLAPFHGKPLAAWALQLACSLPFNRVFFVAASPPLLQLAAGYNATPLHNQNPGRGAVESIRLGVEASEAEYYLFFPCDQPLLDKATVQAVLARAAPGKIVYPTFNGRPGNPALFHKQFRQQLLTLPDGEGARPIKRQNPHALVEIPLPNGLPLADADTPGELASLAALYPANELVN